MKWNAEARMINVQGFEMLYTTQKSKGIKRQRIDCLRGKHFLEEMTFKKMQDSKKHVSEEKGFHLGLSG